MRPRSNPKSVPEGLSRDEYDAIVRQTAYDLAGRIVAFRQRAPYARWNADTWPKTAAFVAQCFRDACALQFLAEMRSLAASKLVLGGAGASLKGPTREGARNLLKLCERAAVLVEKRMAQVAKDGAREEVWQSRAYWSARDGADRARAHAVEKALALGLAQVENDGASAAAQAMHYSVKRLCAGVLSAMGRPDGEVTAVETGVVTSLPILHAQLGPHTLRTGTAIVASVFVLATGLGRFKPTSKKDL